MIQAGAGGGRTGAPVREAERSLFGPELGAELARFGPFGPELLGSGRSGPSFWEVWARLAASSPARSDSCSAAAVLPRMATAF